MIGCLFRPSIYVPMEMEDTILSHLDFEDLRKLVVVSKGLENRITKIDTYNIEINKIFKNKLQCNFVFREDVTSLFGGARNVYFFPESSIVSSTSFSINHPIIRGDLEKVSTTCGVLYNEIVSMIALKVKCYLKEEYLDDPLCQPVKLAITINYTHRDCSPWLSFSIFHNIQGTNLYERAFDCENKLNEIKELFDKKILFTKESEWGNILSINRLIPVERNWLSDHFEWFFWRDKELILILDESNTEPKSKKIIPHRFTIL